MLAQSQPEHTIQHDQIIPYFYTSNLQNTHHQKYCCTVLLVHNIPSHK